jgi:hypothetical protein
MEKARLNMFQHLRQETKSRLVELFTKYRQVTVGTARLADFKDLIRRGFSEQQIEAVVNWLSVHRAGFAPGTPSLVRNFKALLAEAELDPVASKLPVSIQAYELWERIVDNSNSIDPEYVQAALQDYKAYFKEIEGTLLYQYLPSAVSFVYDWFVLMARNGSPRVRRFRVDHPKFVEYLRLVKRASERA